MRIPRKHTREFKLKLCRDIAKGKLSKNAASIEYGLSHGMLDRWVAQFHALGKDAFQGSKWRADAAQYYGELEELRLQVQELKRENAELRKKLGQRAR
jgi:transposase-like protein